MSHISQDINSEFAWMFSLHNMYDEIWQCAIALSVSAQGSAFQLGETSTGLRFQMLKFLDHCRRSNLKQRAALLCITTTVEYFACVSFRNECYLSFHIIALPSSTRLILFSDVQAQWSTNPPWIKGMDLPWHFTRCSMSIVWKLHLFDQLYRIDSLLKFIIICVDSVRSVRQWHISKFQLN